MAESDDFPELVPESSASIAAHNASDRETVRDAEKGFHHIAGICPTMHTHTVWLPLTYRRVLPLSTVRSIHAVARLLQPFVQDAG